MQADVFDVSWKDQYLPGIKGVLEVNQSSLPVSPDFSVADFIGFLNVNSVFPQEPSVDSIRVARFILLYGAKQDDDRPFTSLLPEIMTGYPRLTLETRTIKLNKKAVDMIITVRCETGKKTLLVCNSMDTILQIKTKAYQKSGYPIEGHRLVYDAKTIEDDLTLADYDVKLQDTVGMIFMMRSCRIQRIDYCKDATVTELPFLKLDDTRYCRAGLNIEGRCGNRKCMEFGKLVIHQMQLRESFSLVTDNGAVCPECQSDVKPVTCGVYDCLWKVDGVRIVDGRVISTSWSNAPPDKYYRITGGISAWQSVLVVTKYRHCRFTATVEGLDEAWALLVRV